MKCERARTDRRLCRPRARCRSEHGDAAAHRILRRPPRPLRKPSRPHLHEPGLYAIAPAGLRRRVVEALAAESPPASLRPARRQWLQLAAACIAAAVLGSGTTYLSPISGDRRSLTDEVATNHVHSLLAENRVVDVPSSDEHTMSRGSMASSISRRRWST